MTDAETVLWRHLRSDRFFGLKFRRQETIGPWVADFCCHDHFLVIELDGGQHMERKPRDDQRTSDLEQRGYRVLRFWNHDVLGNTEVVLEEIGRVAGVLNIPSPTPLPPAGEGNR